MGKRATKKERSKRYRQRTRRDVALFKELSMLALNDYRFDDFNVPRLVLYLRNRGIGPVDKEASYRDALHPLFEKLSTSKRVLTRL